MNNLNRKTQPRIWQFTYLLNRAITRSLRTEISQFFRDGGWRVLDVGCGGMPYQALFTSRCREYVGCDLHPSSAGIIKCPADALSFANESFDALVSFQVLEHVKRPWQVLKECARVLRRGGILLVTAPFVFPHHSSPNDYFRYTHEGLAALAEEAGLQVEKVTAQCSSLSTLLLLGNWYLMRPACWFKRRVITRPLAWLLTWTAVVPANVLGLLLDTNWFRRSFRKGNEGYSNYLMVCRKA